MAEFMFRVPGEPRGKGRPKATARGPFVRMYTDAKTASYENLVKLCALEAMGGMAPFKSAVCVEVVAYLAIPKSTPKKRLPGMLSGIISPIKKPDLDNVMKAVLDGLNTVAFTDDALVVQLSGSKFYSDEPRLVVTVREI